MALARSSPIRSFAAADSKRKQRQEIEMTRKTLLGGVALAAMAASIAAAPVAAAEPGVRAGVTDGTLRVVGGPSSDKITLRLSPVDRTQLQVDVGDNGSADRTFDLNTFDAIDVEGGNGNDTIR